MAKLQATKTKEQRNHVQLYMCQMNGQLELEGACRVRKIACTSCSSTLLHPVSEKDCVHKGEKTLIHITCHCCFSASIYFGSNQSIKQSSKQTSKQKNVKLKREKTMYIHMSNGRLALLSPSVIMQCCHF